MQKMACSQEDNLCSLHASYILLGYFVSCLPKRSIPVVEQLTVCYPVTAAWIRHMLPAVVGEGGDPNVIFSMKWCHWHESVHRLTDKWTVELPPSERRWAGSTEVQRKRDLWASSCRTSSAQCLSQLSSASSLLVLVAGPAPPSRAEKLLLGLDLLQWQGKRRASRGQHSHCVLATAPAIPCMQPVPCSVMQKSCL